MWGTWGPCHSQPRTSLVAHASQEPRNRSELEQRDADQKLILGLGQDALEGHLTKLSSLRADPGLPSPEGHLHSPAFCLFPAPNRAPAWALLQP